MNKISSALRQYEQERRTKQGILLLPNGGYYLFDKQFCGIQEYELSLSGKDLQIQGVSVPCGIFFGIVGDTLQWAVRDTGVFSPDRLSLIFHIALEKEDKLLRGILFAQNKNAWLSLFTDPTIEKLYRAASAPVISSPADAAGGELAAYAQDCAQKDLHRLTALYLHGNSLSQLQKKMEGDKK